MSERQTAPTAPKEALRQEKPSKNIPPDPAKLIGHVSHDELCDTMHERLKYLDGDMEDDLYSISIADLNLSSSRLRCLEGFEG
uniref:Uncharacterized protein n=1 Tax=Nelumbo nucifera TaxID=4432 RepID=A0A822ZP84_NELNU|nr:TPA_asm: hypothetical protein HUJ06_001828 [Nelumbo nucifera]